MGRSYTIHCIGYAKIKNGKRRMFYAMNRLEIEQQRVLALQEGLQISEWRAQTRTGKKILKITEDDYSWGYISDDKVGNVCKTIPCPICNLDGCFVCNHSGITKNKYWEKWQDWQLEKEKAKHISPRG